jgi:hypothetical protein
LFAAFLPVLIAALLPADALASSLHARVRFDPSDLSVQEAPHGSRADLSGAIEVGGEDAPVLPMAVRVFYVPEGQEVTGVTVTPGAEVLLEGVSLRAPIASAAEESGRTVHRAFPAGARGDGGGMVPERAGVSLGGGNMAGHRLHTVALFPVRWSPADGSVRFTRTFDVELQLRPSGTLPGLARSRPLGGVAGRSMAAGLSGMVANPADLPVSVLLPESSPHPTGLSGRGLPGSIGSFVEMVIVTTDSLAPSFQELADWKTAKGVPAVVRTVEWIEANYPGGHDLPERIRLFLRDAHSRWGTGLALLGGDYALVPPRAAFNRFYYGGSEIPTDQYYACLDGDWNGDGDEYYGEGEYNSDPGDSVDLFPDIFVGRAPVQSVAEVNNFVAKSRLYATGPPAGYVEDHTVFGEVLFPSDWEYGDSQSIITLDGKALAQAMDSHVAPSWARTKLYQSDGGLNRDLALAQLSRGPHMLTIMGHGDAFKFSVGDSPNPLIYVADTDSLTNWPHLTMVMATACNPNQFDLECQGESLMNNPTGGAVCVVGPTRVDFPVSSSAFHEGMYRLMFDHGVTGLGAANQMHRIPYAAISVSDATSDRWTLLTKILMGDPELSLWTREPQDLVVTHAGAVTHGLTSLTVSVADTTGTPLADALVCVSGPGGTYGRAVTDVSGQAALDLSAGDTDSLSVVVTLPEYLPYVGSTLITPAAGALLALSSHETDDDSTGGSSGNGDGTIDAGETVELDLLLANDGGANASAVSVAASVEAGSSATFDLFVNGIRNPAAVFIGPDRVNPPAVPFTIDFAAPFAPTEGKPSFVFTAHATAGDVGVFLWQDDSGWHLEWGTGMSSMTVAGMMQTDGRFRSVAPTKLEDGADGITLNPTSTQVNFAGTVDSDDLADAFDFSMADSTMLSVVSASASVGTVAAGGTGSGTVSVGVSGAARAGQVAYVDLEISSASGGPWSASIPVVFAGPALSAFVIAVDDSSGAPVSGDGDGIVEVGETVRLTTRVANRGNGAADGVTGVVSAATGIAFVDSTDSFGAIAAGEEASGVGGFLFTVTDPSGVSVDLSITDSVGRAWDKTVEFVAPSAPTDLSFTSTESVITLTWEASADADLAGYNLYRSPTSGSGFDRVHFDLLRTGTRFVDAGLSLSSAFYYRVAAVDSSGNESAASDELFTWTTQRQLPGWPQNAGSNVFASILSGDSDGDGDGEVFVGSQNFSLHAWNSDGTVISGFPVSTSNQIWGTPAMADLDGDNDQEILWGSMDTRVYLVHHDGSPVFGSSALFVDLPLAGEMVRSTPCFADVDLDSELEFIVGTGIGTLYGFNHDGTTMGDSTGLIYTASPGNSSARIWGPMPVVDLEDDGSMEIVFASWNNKVYAIDSDGNLKPGFPRSGTSDFRSGAVVADLDVDGTMEILAGSIDRNLYVFDHDGGDYLPGGSFHLFPGDLRSVPAIGQLDADPELEIVVSCMDGHLYAYNHDGTGLLNPNGLFASIDSASAISASPILVDVDGDLDFEVFVGHRNGSFYGFHHDGTGLVGMPVPTASSIYATASASDLDGDGDIEVVFASYDQTVNVLDFDGPSVPEAYEWATYAGNSRRTGVYGDSDLSETGVGVGMSASPAFALSAAVPNPFHRATTIRFALPENGPATLRVFNVSGQLVKTLVTAPMERGDHSVRWDGRDATGLRLSSGVYFYRLDSAGLTKTRKTLLLR